MPIETERLEAVIAQQRDQIEELEAKLKELTIPEVEPRWPIHLTPMEGVMAAMFLKHRDKVLSKEQIMTFLYSARPYADQPQDVKIIDVVVCKLRRKFRLLNVTIGTVWGRGYCIDHDNHAKLHLLAYADAGHPAGYHPDSVNRSANVK